MLTLTKKVEYALIASAHLSRAGARIVSAREVAERYRLSLPLLMNVLKTLHKSGLLRSARGARGGYSLAAPAERVSLARLIELVEGPARLVRCVGRTAADARRCELLATCPVRHPIERLQTALESFLESYSVADIAGDAAFGATANEARPVNLLRVLAQ